MSPSWINLHLGPTLVGILCMCPFVVLVVSGSLIEADLDSSGEYASFAWLSLERDNEELSFDASLALSSSSDSGGLLKSISDKPLKQSSSTTAAILPSSTNSLRINRLSVILRFQSETSVWQFSPQRMLTKWEVGGLTPLWVVSSAKRNTTMFHESQTNTNGRTRTLLAQRS